MTQQSNSQNLSNNNKNKLNNNDKEEKIDNNSPESKIKEVWASNFEKEIEKIQDIVEEYPYVAVDTSFPGIVACLVGEFETMQEYRFSLVRENVNLLNLIQVGFTFYNDKGETRGTWEFNFKFSTRTEMFAPDSMQLLLQSGFDFNIFVKDGIPYSTFAEGITMSGLLLNEDIKWICFSGAYDFGYLLKTLTGRELAKDEKTFFWILNKYFPSFYDIKVLISSHSIPGGLQKLADLLKVARHGKEHHAGSGSLLTGDVFFKIRSKYLKDDNKKKFTNILYGIGAKSIILDKDFQPKTYPITNKKGFTCYNKQDD